MSYRNLEIWQLARGLAVEIHRMSLEDLPAFEKYEEGSQIRRSIKSVRSNIVEGYGRRRYKQEFIKFLTYAQASCDETIDHLDMLRETDSLSNEPRYVSLHQALDLLGRKLNLFIRAVDSSHQAMREERATYEVGEHPATSIQHPASSIQRPASSI